MARKEGWTRKGRKGRFRYYDSRSAEITDPARLARIESLVIPPAWRDVWIAPRAGEKLQATGVDAAGRRQYLYHPEYRAAQWEGGVYSLTSKRLNDYIGIYMGPEFTAKDFRTWGGTLLAAIALAERGVVEPESEAKRVATAVMKRVAGRLGNTPPVTRASYVSPAVIEQYLDGRTLEDFRPPHLRLVAARQSGLDPEEQALLTLLRSWRIRRARIAA